MTAINLLHLTDLHQNTKDRWQWETYKHEFFTDLVRVSKVAGPWDLILFSGDLTSTGSKKEFDALEKTLEEIREELRSPGPAPLILAVPGNHDLRRNGDPGNAVVRALRGLQEDRTGHDAFWNGKRKEYRKELDRNFKQYLDWWQQSEHLYRENLSRGEMPGDFATTYVKDGMRLGVVGLNTAFVQVTGGDFHGKLGIHTKQLDTVCGGNSRAWFDEHHFAILMTHHPPDWLHRDAKAAHFDQGIFTDETFVMHVSGHVHESRSKSLGEGGAAARLFWNGISLFGGEHFEKHEGQEKQAARAHGYAAMRLELDGQDHGLLRIWPRKAYKIHDTRLHISRDKDFKLKEFTGDASEGSLEHRFKLRGGPRTDPRGDPVTKAGKAEDLGTPRNASSRENRTSLTECLATLSEKAPPYVAGLADGLLRSERPPEKLRELGQVIVRHVTALIAAADLSRGGDPRAGRALDVPSLGWIADAPVFVEQRAAQESVAIFFGRRLSSGQLAQTMREVIEARDDTLAAALVELVEGVDNVLRLPIYEAGSVDEDYDAVELSCREFRAHQPDLLLRRRLPPATPRPSTGHCFVIVPASRSPVSQGWLVDLYPLITRVFPRDVDGMTHDEGPLGLVASPDLFDGLPIHYHTEAGLLRARPAAKGTRKSRGAFAAAKEWYAEDEDPALVERVEQAGFSIVKRIGLGSFGTVYRVTHATNPTKPLAMKVLHGHIRMSQRESRRFQREIERISELHRHGNGRSIVRYEVEIPDALRLENHAHRWFVMELVEGEPLSDWCARLKSRCQPFERSRLQKLLIEDLVRGVAALHRAGIIHRDIHPDNIIVRRDSNTYIPVIIDLGLACFPPRSTSSAQSMSLAPAGLGRPPFAAPEQREGREERHSDPRVDVHALGWTIAHVLNDGKIVEEMDALPEPWRGIVLRCTSREPALRPRDAVALSDELLRCSVDESFAVGRTLADGSYAIGSSPVLGRGDLLQVVPAYPYSDLRAWAVRIEVTNSTTDLQEIAKLWRELESAGVPMCPLISSGCERKAGIVSVGVFERFLSRHGLWSTLARWGTAGSVRDAGAVLAATLDLIRLLCEAGVRGLKAQVSPQDVLVSRSGELRIFRISLPASGSRHGREWLRIIECAHRGIPEQGMDGISALIGFHPFGHDGVEYEAGRLELRRIGAIQQTALDVVQDHAGVFDGNPSAWTERDGLVLDALRMAFSPVLNGWSVTIDRFALEELDRRRRFNEWDALQRVQDRVEQERLRAEHEAEQERLRAEHEAEQERLRAEHEAEQERLRAEHEAEQERLRTEGRTKLPEFKASSFERTEFRREEMKENPPDDRVFPERRRSESTPSTIVYQFSRPVTRNYIEEDGVQEAQSSSLAQRLDAATAVAAGGDAFLVRRSLRAAQSGAWLIALLWASESADDIVQRLTSIAEERPWWRPEGQLMELLALGPGRLTFEPPLIREDERAALHGMMVALDRQVDHEGLALPGAEADAKDTIANFVSTVCAIIRDIEIRQVTLDSRETVYHLAVRGGDERVLRAPIARGGHVQGPCWIHGLQSDGVRLRGSYGAPPATPLEWASVAMERHLSDLCEEAFLLAWNELLSLLDAPRPDDHAVVRNDGGTIVLVWQRGAGGCGVAAAIVWYPEEQRLQGLSDMFGGDTVTGRAMACLFALWLRERIDGAIGAEWEARFVSNLVPIGALRGLIDPDTGSLVRMLGDRAAMDAWAERYRAPRQDLGLFGSALRLELTREEELNERVDERMGRLGLRMGPKARAVAIDLVREWIELSGQAKQVTRESLLAAIERRDLRALHEEAPPTRLYIHGWVKQAWDRKPTIELDWTGYFERRTRRVATQEEWDSALLPQLDQAKRELAQMPDSTGKYIDFRGKLPLSALMAIGAELPAVGSYRFRVEQPTKEELFLWRSDAKPSSLQLDVVEERSTGEGEDGLLVLSITDNAMPEVERWLERGMRAAFRALVHVRPASGWGPAALGSDGDAVALAEDSKARIRELRQRHGVRRVHIVPFAPAGFCLFLGQRMNALGEIVVYERTADATYQTGVILKTG